MAESKSSRRALTGFSKPEPHGWTVVLRLKVPADVWAAAKCSAVRRIETKLAEIVTQTLRLAAKDAEGGA